MKHKLERLPLGTVRPRGWLLQQLKRDLSDGFAARLDQLTPHASHDLFRERIASSEDFLAWWDAETRGNWLWGYVQMAILADEPVHTARVQALIEELLATRDDDGYLGIYGPSERYRHGAGENGELWAQSRALLPLIAWYEWTREARVFDTIRRAVDLTLEHYPAGKPYFVRGTRVGRDAITGLTHGLCYLDVLEWLKRETGDKRYGAAAVRFYLEFSDMPRPFPNDDLALANLKEAKHTFGGHAVHTAEHLRALLFAHVSAPEQVTFAAVETALKRLQLYRLPSGALPGDENIHGMPMPEAPYEYCTTAELASSLCSAIEKLGDAALGDWLELVVFNAAQGARTADGRAIAYLSADTRLSATADRADAHSQGAPGRRFKYSPTHDDVACCCNPNAVRLLPQFIGGMWQRLSKDEGFAAVAYGPCQLRAEIGGIEVTITEETNYPFDDSVELIVSTAKPLEFTLSLRKPAWGAMQVNAEVTEQDGWLNIRRTWTKEDRIRIDFEWPVRAERYGNGEAALLRGPLQYALPLDYELLSIRDYAGTDLHDYDVVPKDIGQGYRVPVIDPSTPDCGARFEQSAFDVERPWDEAGFALSIEETKLIPIGCTLLRRAGFPSR